MTITSAKALRLISNHEVVKFVPELLMAVEAYAAADREWNPRQKCPGCVKQAYFGPVEEKALAAIAGLSAAAVTRLKEFLGVKGPLYVNVPRPGQAADLKELA